MVHGKKLFRIIILQSTFDMIPYLVAFNLLNFSGQAEKYIVYKIPYRRAR